LDAHCALVGKRRNAAITEANLAQNDGGDRWLTLVAALPLDCFEIGRRLGGFAALLAHYQRLIRSMPSRHWPASVRIH